MTSTYKLMLAMNAAVYASMLMLVSFAGWYHFRVANAGDLKQCEHCELKFDLFENMARSPVYWFDRDAKRLCHFCYNTEWIKR